MTIAVVCQTIFPASCSGCSSKSISISHFKLLSGPCPVSKVVSTGLGKDKNFTVAFPLLGIFLIVGFGPKRLFSIRVKDRPSR
ncbi:MAG: hypothetical protein [Circular genetic element sp.]|nr:MAG: hypothetical protein [Circular genetic element sp.]